MASVQRARRRAESHRRGIWTCFGTYLGTLSGHGARVLQVVAAMPRVTHGHLVDALGPVLRMMEAACPLFFREGAQERDEAAMDTVNDRERELHRRLRSIVKICPGGLIVGFDGRPILGQGH